MPEIQRFGAIKRSFLWLRQLPTLYGKHRYVPALPTPSIITQLEAGCGPEGLPVHEVTIMFPPNSSIYSANHCWGFLLIRETGLKRSASSGCVPALPTHFLRAQEPRAAHPMPHSKPQHDSKSSAETSTLTLAFVCTQILSEIASTAPKACGQPQKPMGRPLELAKGEKPGNFLQ